MLRHYAVAIEKDIESGLYIGSVPSIVGAHTCAETIDELRQKLTEVMMLCLEEAEDMDFCLQLLEGSERDTDPNNHETISFEIAIQEAGFTIADLQE